jgi:hypothetical protein
MSFGESVFLAGFNRKTTKGDLFVKGKHGIIPWHLRGKTLEESRRLSVEGDHMSMTCEATQPPPKAARPLVGPTYQ